MVIVFFLRFFCRCNALAQGGMRRPALPKLPFSENGWFLKIRAFFLAKDYHNGGALSTEKRLSGA
jgi:hypothetical protein